MSLPLTVGIQSNVQPSTILTMPPGRSLSQQHLATICVEPLTQPALQ
jgi:hypothetical protein